MSKQLKVTCDTKLSIPLDELTEIQGEMKSFTEESYKKFQNLVVSNGIWFPTYVVKEHDEIDGKKVTRWCIVDGTGRKRMFSRMRNEGWTIPRIPCVEIQADDREQMRIAILAASSSFHKVTEQGLHDFMVEGGLVLSDLEPFEIPLNMESFRETFYGEEEPKLPPSGVPKETVTFEIDPNAKKHDCPRCGYKF